MAAVLQEIQGFQRDSLTHVDTIVRSVALPAYEVPDESGAVIHRSASAVADDASNVGNPMEASAQACHGNCYGFEKERNTWEPPRVAAWSHKEARPGYESMDASEYLDTAPTFKAKVRVLAQLVRKSRRCMVYSGAGLSTGAGIGDYASQAAGSLSGTAPPPRAVMLAEICSRDGSTTPAAPTIRNMHTTGLQHQPVAAEVTSCFRSPLCSQPTAAHRVLVAMQAAGLIHRWINQNHDGLPQKAGLPQEAINEIHGGWHAPDNPVVQMSGSVRDDLFADLLECERDADLAIAVGTSLCGMNADRVVLSPATRAAQGIDGQLGSVVIGLQRTVHDKSASLRIFARCDDIFTALAQELAIDVAPALPVGEFFAPAILAGRPEPDYIFKGIPYDAFGERSTEFTSTLDLRDDTEVVIPSGMHAGAIGIVDGFDREGNIRCRFKLRPTVGKLRAPVMLLLGRWWIQAAVDGTVPVLPVVNKAATEDQSQAAESLRIAIQTYSS